jgi:outer membrane protein assembly factor BamB
MPSRLLVFAVTITALHADEWGRFRGPNGRGIAADTGYPVEFGRGKNILWRTPVRSGKSSPVLTRDRIFLTAAAHGKLYTLCHDRKTGRLLWERAIDQPRAEIHNGLNHTAAITPVTDGENVYVFFKDFGLVSYDGDGGKRWEAPLGPFKNTQGLSSSPILAGGSLILVADQWEDSFIAAYDPASGAERWEVLREEGEGWGTPVLYQRAGGSVQILTTSRGRLGLHDAETGRRDATLAGIATTFVGSPFLDGDTVYNFGYGSDEPPIPSLITAPATSATATARSLRRNGTSSPASRWAPMRFPPYALKTAARASCGAT